MFKSFVLALTAGCAVLPLDAVACRILSEEEAAVQQQANIEQARNDARTLYMEADLVFVGRMAKLAISRETVQDAMGRDVVWQTHQAQFVPIEQIKGAYMPGHELEYKLNRSVVEIGCRLPFVGNLPYADSLDKTYLVYARDGKVLRTNLMAPDLQVLSGQAEAEALRGLR